MKSGLYTRTIQIRLLFILLFPASAAGLGAEPYYHQNADRLFWFMLISDTHVGAADVQDTNFLAWVKEYDFGSYLFLGVSTAGNDGASFSIWPWDNFGDHAGLDAGELDFIEDNLIANPDAELALIFGHHPFEADSSDWTETALTYGLGSFLNLIDSYGVSLYGYGHTHQYQEDVYFQDLSNGIFYIPDWRHSSGRFYRFLDEDIPQISIASGLL